MLDRFARVEVRSREALRAWLHEHHGQADSIWLVRFKKGRGRPYVSYSDVVDEVLCFGWIDSRPAKLDADRSMLLLSPRRAGSAWSQVNKARVTRLIAAGLMTPAGLTKIEAAKADGSWAALDAVSTLAPPDDLLAALRARPEAERHFTAFSPSSRRGILEWIAAARRPETRLKRIRETADLAARNLKANHPAGRDRG